MGEPENGAMLRVAEAISDRTPVDWESEVAAQPGFHRLLQGLRVVEKVATVHDLPGSLADRPPDEDMTLPGQATLRGTEDSGPSRAQPPSWGPLKILELIARGGFGEIYRAYDPGLQVEVALKLLRPDRALGETATRRFLREARRLARIRHPSVLVVHGADRHEGRVGLWTELLKGKTLEQLLTEQGAFGADEAARLGMDVCRALAAVHAAGLVHRDVKTTNVMREEGGRIVLMDFGSVTESRAWSGAAAREGLSGTPMYMAPEVLRGEKPTAASDLYSLGVVLYRLVTCRMPIWAEDWQEMLDKHRRGEAVPLRDARADLPEAFVRVVERALDPDPRRRYTSAGAMERALAAGLGWAAEREPGARPGAVASRRLRLAIVAAGLLLCVLGVVLWHQVVGPRALRVEASLYRQAAPVSEQLDPGARVRPGDRLFLEIQGQQALYVYVLNEDARGESFVLFPIGLELANPLAAEVRHRLPGDMEGRPAAWEVTSAGGRETLVVIASREPLADLERDIASIPRAQPGHRVVYAPVSAQSMQALRSIGGVVLIEGGEPPTGGTSAGANRLSVLGQALSAAATRSRKIWVRVIELENP